MGVIGIVEKIKPSTNTVKYEKGLLIFLSSLTICGCTVNLGLELNKARSTDDSTYGYTVDNPIEARFMGVSGDSLIQEYVKRLARNGDLNSYRISKITVIQYDDNNLHTKQHKETVKECILISEDKKETIKLYFNTSKKNKKLKIPKGFFYGRLSGK